MSIKILSFIWAGFFSMAMGANPMFNPYFSGAPTFIPAGTAIMPLCNYPGDPSCLGQWSSQALPLATYPSGLIRSPIKLFYSFFYSRVFS